ncbi:MAG: RNA polymerase sigma-70 factor [Muribaculaceae bacterium]|nr:RNA polymerase sigma-70 factor [Muribaculaceae bacterium]
MTDTQLVIELREGSVKAFDMIYHRYVNRLYAYCFPYIKSRQMTEEVVQDVFVNLWRYRDRIDPEKDLSVLLFTVARRYRINALRSVVNAPVYEDYVDYQNHLSSEDRSTLEYDDLRRMVMRLLRRLPRTQRQVFMLSRFENLTTDEISRKLNLAEKTVANQLSLALKNLRQAMSQAQGLIHLLMWWLISDSSTPF